MLVADGAVSASDGALDVAEGGVDPLEGRVQGGLATGSKARERLVLGHWTVDYRASAITIPATAFF